MNLSWYVPKANVDHTISGQRTAVSTLDHSATTQNIIYMPDVVVTNNNYIIINSRQMFLFVFVFVSLIVAYPSPIGIQSC